MRGRRSTYRRNGAIGSKTDEGQEYKAEPSKTHVNQWNLMSVHAGRTPPDGSVLTHGFKAIHKELGSDGHKSDGNDDGTEANPRVGFGVRLREVAFLFLEGIGGGWVEFESVVLAGGLSGRSESRYS
jgi:hypothetical protein